MKRKLAIALTAGLATVALTACGPEEGGSSSEEGASETPSTSEEASEEPTEEPTEETTEETTESADPEAGADADLTPPGEELSIGDSATVITEEGAVVELTVTELEEGTKAHLDQLQVQEDTSTMTPFFVHMKAEVVSGNAENYDPALDITGMVGDQPATQLIKFSAFEPCENDGFDPGDTAGATVESCTIQIADKGSKVDGAAFTATDTDYDKYDGQPVYWR